MIQYWIIYQFFKMYSLDGNGKVVDGNGGGEIPSPVEFAQLPN